MNRSLFHVISGGYGMLTGSHKHAPEKKKFIEWKVDDTVQVSHFRFRAISVF
jgi:hypothetical protein